MDSRIMDLQQLFGQQVSYRIPVFQRPYAWTLDDQWAPLWADIVQKTEDLLNGNEKVSAHFMGAVILQLQSANNGEVAKRIVVDGQQRLTTLQLLIAAVQHCYIALGYPTRASRLGQWLTNDENFWSGEIENQTKVRQAHLSDRTSFQDVIREGEPRGQSRSIDRAFEYFKEQVDVWLNEEPGSIEARCDTLEEVLGKHVRLAIVDLDVDEKPHFIFSVLNARAEPLKQSDHIKNEIMYRADVIDDETTARALWGPFDSEQWWRDETSEGRLVRIHLDRFLHYWTSMRTVREFNSNQVYAQFKNYVDSGDKNIRRVASEIREAGRLYRSMIEAKVPGIELFLKRIWTMELGVVMPLLLYLYTRDDLLDDQRQRTTRVIESFLVRRMLLGVSSNGLNRLFFDLLQRLGDIGPHDIADTCLKFLEGGRAAGRAWPRDDDVWQQLTYSRFAGTQRRRVMVLEAIERHLREDGKSEGLAEENLSLEHIMPDRWETHWPLVEAQDSDEEPRERREQLLNHIGNLTLVTGKLNTKLSNAPWFEKRKALNRHTTLRLNFELLEMAGNVWDEDAIERRSKWMAEKIIEIWPYADKI